MCVMGAVGPLEGSGPPNLNPNPNSLELDRLEFQSQAISSPVWSFGFLIFTVQRTNIFLMGFLAEDLTG